MRSSPSATCRAVRKAVTLRENVRFTLWGPRGAPIEEVSENFSARRMESYAHEAAQDWLDFIAGSRLLARRLIR